MAFWMAVMLLSEAFVITSGKGEPMQGKRSATEPELDHVIHLSIQLNVPAERAFAYFTQNDLITGWLAPQAHIEAKVNGRYELFWQPADRLNNSTIGCRVTAFSEGQFLSFQWRSPMQFKAFANTADPLTHVVVMCFPTDAGCRVHLVHSGWRSSPEWEEARAWQERAWSLALAELDRVAQ